MRNLPKCLTHTNRINDVKMYIFLFKVYNLVVVALASLICIKLALPP